MLLYLTRNIYKDDDSQYSPSHLTHIKSAFIFYHKENKCPLSAETEVDLEDFIISIKKMSTEVNINYILTA